MQPNRIAAGAGSGPIAATLGLHLPTRAEPLHMNVTEATTPFLDGLLQHAAQPITVKQLHSGQVLVGGGKKNITLQPIALEGGSGLGAAAGAGYLFLEPLR